MELHPPGADAARSALEHAQRGTTDCVSTAGTPAPSSTAGTPSPPALAEASIPGPAHGASDPRGEPDLEPPADGEPGVPPPPDGEPDRQYDLPPGSPMLLPVPASFDFSQEEAIDLQRLDLTDEQWVRWWHGPPAFAKAQVLRLSASC